MKKIGMYNPYLDTRGGGEKVYLALAAVLAKAGHDVTLITHDTVDLEGTARYFGIDVTGLKTLVIKPNVVVRFIARLPIPGGIKNYFHDLSIFGAIRKQRYDVFINNCYQSNLPNPSPLGVYMCMFPQKITKKGTASTVKRLYLYILGLLYRLTFHPRVRHGVYTYGLVTANSKYTQAYIKQYWGVESSILYPICEDMHEVNAGKKQKVILNVGRFFEKTTSNHHKRQDFLLDSFKQLTDMHKDGWELHLAGSVAEDVGSLKYILELIRDGSGFPIVFHFNTSFTEIKHLYNQASIYWHATGYGSDPLKFPEKQEHFGISTVEAMSAGAIPIVINAAGQKESVEQGKNGYLWNNQEELLEQTKHVTIMPDSKLTDLRKNAQARAKEWNMAGFAKLVLNIFQDILEP